MSSPQELMLIADRFQLYISMILFTVGSIGALLNMYVLSRGSLRTNPCSCYLFAQSFSDLCVLVNSLFMRILFFYSIGTYTNNDIYCPFRGYIIAVSTLCSSSYLCFAAFDRCMCTSREQRQRRWSSHAFSYRSILIVFIIWLSINIPHLLFVRRNGNTCGNLSTQFTLYINYFANPILYSILPIVVLFYFGNRTVKNIRSLRQGSVIGSRLDRHFNRMLLIQIIFSIFTSVPLMVYSIYFGITFTMSKDTTHRSIEYMIAQIVRSINNLNYVSAFYMNLIALPEVRRIMKKMIICRYNIVVPDIVVISDKNERQMRKDIGIHGTNIIDRNG